MKIKGFTVTEVVIVTGIIGIIAVLTMPAFISNQKKQTYSKSLQVAIVNLEAVMSNLLVSNGVEDLLETDAWNLGVLDSSTNKTSDARLKGFVYDVGRGMAITSFGRGVPRTYQKLDGTGTTTLGKPVRITAKNGVEYYIEIDNTISENEKLDELEVLENNLNYINKAATVYIDINGPVLPNIYGRDLFRFDLGADGILYPFGGEDYKFYHLKKNNKLTFVTPKVGCIDKKNGDYCAAYLMNNNYEMNY